MRFLDETNLFTRDDTFFGICQGLGEDLGVNPNWFRLALALGLFFSPLGTLAAYAVAGLFVFTVRWLVPTLGTTAPAESPAAATATLESANETVPAALAA